MGYLRQVIWLRPVATTGSLRPIPLAIPAMGTIICVMCITTVTLTPTATTRIGVRPVVILKSGVLTTGSKITYLSQSCWDLI